MSEPPKLSPRTRHAPRACQACGREFYSGRSDARTCGDRCRQRLRRKRGNGGRRQARPCDRSVTGYSGEVPVRIRARSPDPVTDNNASRRLAAGVLPAGVVRDTEWPDMYRVRRIDGTLSDMLNLTRATEATRLLETDSERGTAAAFPARR